jgi:hypothetical protein
MINRSHQRDGALVLKIRHEVDGPAVVRVWDDSAAAAGKVEVDEVSLRSPSGVPRVSTARGDRAVRISIPGARVRVKVLASSRRDPDDVDLIVTPGSPERARGMERVPTPTG